jgi:transcriptional regulator with XRE-family HTH domain
MTIGIRIKTLRKQRGLNQTQLGEMLGVTLNTVFNIESGKTDISSETLKKISEIFEVSADYLLTGKEGTSDISEEEREILEFVRKDVDFKKAVTQAANFKKKAINYLSSYQSQHAHAA